MMLWIRLRSSSSAVIHRNPPIDVLLPHYLRHRHLVTHPSGCYASRPTSSSTTTTTITTNPIKTSLRHVHPTALTRNLRSPYSSRPFDSIDDADIQSSIEPTGEASKPLNAFNLKEQPPSGNQARTPIRSSAITFKTLEELYRKQIPITMLTAHDFATARMVGMSASNQIDHDSTQAPIGIDVCLCGDSLANVCLGYQSTTELGLEEFTYHLKAIRRGLDSLKHEPYYRIPLLVADLPFGTFESSVEQGVQTATDLIRAARVDGIKVEGGRELEPLIKRLSSFGIPVIGHIGLTPQRATSLGGFKVQGHDCSKKAREIIQDAIDLERSGCAAIVLEAVPVEIVDQIKGKIKIPLIGIGAGPRADGQVLVLSDLIGTLAASPNPSKKINNPKPKFVPNFSHHVQLQPDSNHPTFDLSIQIIRTYIQLVRTRQFPQIGLHTYSMKPEVLSELNRTGWTS